MLPHPMVGTRAAVSPKLVSHMLQPCLASGIPTGACAEPAAKVQVQEAVVMDRAAPSLLSRTNSLFVKTSRSDAAAGISSNAAADGGSSVAAAASSYQQLIRPAQACCCLLFTRRAAWSPACLMYTFISLHSTALTFCFTSSSTCCTIDHGSNASRCDCKLEQLRT